MPAWNRPQIWRLGPLRKGGCSEGRPAARVGRAALTLLALLAAAGCQATAPSSSPPPAYYGEPEETAPASSVLSLAKELGLAVRADEASRSVALEGAQGRIVFLGGTNQVLVEGRRLEVGETIDLDQEDIPLLEEDAKRIRELWKAAAAGGPATRGSPGARRPSAGPRGGAAVAGEKEWGVPLRREWKGILIHHSADDSGNMARIDKYHREVNGWDGIGYDFLICNGDGGPDGLVETTFRWKQQKHGAHAGHGLKEYNDHWIGICLVGNFNETKPTAKQLVSLRRLVRYLQARCDIPDGNIQFHRDVRDTDCPGRKFPVRDFLRGSPRGL